MNTKTSVLIAVIFFLLINTSYYWEAKLELSGIALTFILIAVFFLLAGALIQEVYWAILEKFKQKKRLLAIGFLLLVLTATALKPGGLIDFEKFEGNDLLVAEHEGTVNCYTVLKLKDNFTFKERDVCFGVSIIKGTFKIVHDTIYFHTTDTGRAGSQLYKYAVIKPSTFNNQKIMGKLVRYQNIQDTIGYTLWITKNELQKLENKEIGFR